VTNLLHLWTAFNVYAKANPLVAGAASLWGLGIVTWLCKGVPVRLWNVAKRQCTTSLTFTSASNGTGLQTFANFMRWFEASRWAQYSRSLSVIGTDGGDRRPYAVRTQGEETSDDPGTVVGVGEGSHFFIYRGWPFWLKHSRVKDGSQKEIVYQIDITGLGRDRQRVLDLIEEFRYRPDPTRLGVYAWRWEDWRQMREVPKRSLDTVVVDKAIKDELVANLGEWLKSRAWYEERGLPYKLTCILKGLPGTGKTSLIKALASHLRMNVCLVNLAVMTDQTFEQCLSEAPDRSIIVIEDFDSANAVKARKNLTAKKDAEAKVVAESDDEGIAGLLQGGLTLSGILNALDGVVSLDGKIVFLTTNVYEAIDPALLRKGRVDYTYELGPLTDAEVREYVKVMFPGAEIPQALRFADILGCDLQGLYFDHREDASSFIAAIPKVPHEKVSRVA